MTITNGYKVVPASEAQLVEINEMFSKRRKQHQVFEETLATLRMRDPDRWSSRWKHTLTCGYYQRWSKDARENEGFRLTNAHFCRDRWCPMCQWRDSLKMKMKFGRIINFGRDTQNPELSFRNKKFSFIEVHTRPMIFDDYSEDGIKRSSLALSRAIDTLINGVAVFMRRKAVKESAAGSIRTVKLVSSKDGWSLKLNVLLAVNGKRCGFTKLKDLWAEILGDYFLKVSSRTLKGWNIDVELKSLNEKIMTPIVETRSNAKYLVKGAHTQNAGLIEIFDNACYGRQLEEFEGIFRKIMVGLRGVPDEDGGYKRETILKQNRIDSKVKFNGLEYISAPIAAD